MPSVFDYTVAYVESLSSFPAESARAAGVKGLAIKLYDAGGNPVAKENYDRLKNGGAAGLRSRGFSLGLWACPRFEPETSAAAVSALYGELGLSFCVFETEWEYKSDGGGVDVERLLKPWRSYRPKAYTACAVTGTPPYTFNHAAAQRRGCYLAPENYWLQDGSYDARPCFEACMALNWDMAKVKPCLTGVEGHDLGEAIIRVDRSEFASYSGVFLWRGDMLSLEQYRLLGIADHLSLR